MRGRESGFTTDPRIERLEFHDFGESGWRTPAGSAVAGSNACQPPPSALYSCTLSSSNCVLAVVGADAHGELRALGVEQRQQVDLAAVVQRLRAAERRIGGCRGAVAATRARCLSSFERDERVLDILQRAGDRIFVAQDGFALSALGDVVDRLRAAGVEDRHRQQRGDVGEARRAESRRR